MMESVPLPNIPMSYPEPMLRGPGEQRRSLGVPVADSGKVDRDARYGADP